MRDAGNNDGCDGRLTGGKAMAEAHQLLQLAPMPAPPADWPGQQAHDLLRISGQVMPFPRVPA